MKVVQIDATARFHVKKMGRLYRLSTLRISIVQNPVIAGEIADVPGSIEHATVHFGKFSTLVVLK